MLWFNFILGLSFSFFSLKIIILYYHTGIKTKFKLRIKLNHNKYYLKPSYNCHCCVGLQFTFVFIVFFYCAFLQTKKARQAGAEVYAIGVAAYVRDDVCLYKIRD